MPAEDLGLTAGALTAAAPPPTARFVLDLEEDCLSHPIPSAPSTVTRRRLSDDSCHHQQRQQHDASSHPPTFHISHLRVLIVQYTPKRPMGVKDCAKTRF